MNAPAHSSLNSFNALSIYIKIGRIININEEYPVSRSLLRAGDKIAVGENWRLILKK